MCWKCNQVAEAAAQQEKPDRVHINQMTGVRAFTYSSGTISEKWDDSEPEIKVVEMRLPFQGEVFPYSLHPQERERM